jgi:hypothetical protein
MVVMYSDDKTWDMHYKDWIHIKKTYKPQDDETKPEQFEYRMKLIDRLIQLYESEHK